jgi:ligand-binding SRPBCC domain-containing protein
VPRIRLATHINAPIGRCFDLMRDVDVHTQSTRQTGERAVAGRTSGLLRQGDQVTWEAVHLGIRQRLTVQVTRCEPPHFFEDVMVRGAFRSFTHRHLFRVDGGGTVMTDEFDYAAPFGFLGRLADQLFLERYMRRFLQVRAQHLKTAAEGAASDRR